MKRKKGNKKITIGLFGLTFFSGNKGCEALSYSFVSILQDIAIKRNEKYEVVIFQIVGYKRALASLTGQWPLRLMYPKEQYNNISFKIIPLFSGIFAGILNHYIKKCDVVFEFTAGDSFTDIYGYERALKKMYYAEQVVKFKVPLVMGSQTIGPFANDDIRLHAAKILDNSLKVYARDELSYNCVKEICSAEPILTCDVAFALPYNTPKASDGKTKIGINISGLLWSGGYERNNQFNLTIDYQEYCKKVMEYFVKNEDCEIHIIPHATSTMTTGVYTADNDNIMADELKSLFPEIVIEKNFETPMQAKSKIAEMDFFIGARMHATIGAISSGVATIPVSYSRKFEGLYGSIEYPYLVKGTADSTDEAVENTIAWYKDRENLRERAKNSSKIAKNKLQIFIDGVEDIVSMLSEDTKGE